MIRTVAPVIKRQRLTFRNTSAAPVVIRKEEIVTIPAELASILSTGETFPIPGKFPESTQDLILYKRPSLIDQLVFLEERVILSGKRGWIIGPPGTGKSSAAFAFARQITAQGWVSSWVHCFNGNPMFCIRFEGDSWSSCPFSDFILPESPKSLVFIDGYRNGVADAFLDVARLWWANNQDKYRLVIIGSMAARPDNKNDEVDDYEDIFFADSWVEAEYLAACKNTKLFEAVKHNLDAPLLCDANPDNPSLEDLVAAKFYYAGGSARYMFNRNTMKVKGLIDDIFNVISDLTSYLSAHIGDQRSSVRNRLLNSYHRAQVCFRRRARANAND